MRSNPLAWPTPVGYGEYERLVPELEAAITAGAREAGSFPAEPDPLLSHPAAEPARVRFFVCNNADRGAINAFLPAPLTVDQLRRIANDASSLAANWAGNAAGRIQRRDPSIAAAFTAVFGVPLNTPAANIVQRRLQRASEVLSGGWIQYYCWGSPRRCTECTSQPATYWACSSWGRQYVICLGRPFWESTMMGDKAATLLHEVLHIYFGRLVAHGPGRINNASCFERFVYQVNGHRVHPDTQAACP